MVHAPAFVAVKADQLVWSRSRTWIATLICILHRIPIPNSGTCFFLSRCFSFASSSFSMASLLEKPLPVSVQNINPKVHFAYWFWTVLLLFDDLMHCLDWIFYFQINRDRVLCYRCCYPCDRRSSRICDVPYSSWVCAFCYSYVSCCFRWEGIHFDIREFDGRSVGYPKHFSYGYVAILIHFVDHCHGFAYVLFSDRENEFSMCWKMTTPWCFETISRTSVNPLNNISLLLSRSIVSPYCFSSFQRPNFGFLL